MFLSLAYSSRFISLILLFFFPPLLHAYGYAQSLGVAYIICSLLCLLFFCFEKIRTFFQNILTNILHGDILKTVDVSTPLK